jgi:hypothetical protein
LDNDATPSWVFEHDFIHVAGGKLENLNEWARSRVTWADGKYIPFDEYVKRITPEQIAKEIEEFDKAGAK